MLAKFLQLCDVISRSRLRDAGCRALSAGRTVLGSRAHFAGGGYLSHTELVRTSHPTIFISFFHLFPTGTFTEEYPLHKLQITQDVGRHHIPPFVLKHFKFFPSK